MKRSIIVLLMIFQLASCQVIDRLFKGEVVARVGSAVLYKNEVDALIPKKCSPQDSIQIVEKYIFSWATKHLLLSQAENSLTKVEKNVDKELDDFRTSLLVYRYENLFVQQRLDTLISNEECEQYYADNKESFATSVSIVKAIYIKINSSSPNLQIIKTLSRSSKEEDRMNLYDMCYSSADQYYDFEGQWVALNIIAQEMETDMVSLENSLKSGNTYFEKEDQGITNLVSVYESIAPGKIAPYEYCLERIKEIILSKRKQELLTSLERNLLDDAISSGKLLIYSK